MTFVVLYPPSTAWRRIRLRTHEETAHAAVVATHRRRRRSGAQCCREGAMTASQRGESGDESDDDAEHERESKHHRVDRDLRRARGDTRRQGPKETQSAVCDEHA